jgi:hypothetical protein
MKKNLRVKMDTPAKAGSSKISLSVSQVKERRHLMLIVLFKLYMIPY